MKKAIIGILIFTISFSLLVSCDGEIELEKNELTDISMLTDAEIAMVGATLFGSTLSVISQIVDDYTNPEISWENPEGVTITEKDGKYALEFENYRFYGDDTILDDFLTDERLGMYLIFGIPSILKGTVIINPDVGQVEADLYLRLFFISGAAIYHFEVVVDVALEDYTIKMNGVELDLSYLSNGSDD
jgi:hypothetical protein